MKKVLIALSAMVMLFCTGCLTENFWVFTWSEGVNRAIFAAVNAALAGVTNGQIQL